MSKTRQDRTEAQRSPGVEAAGLRIAAIERFDGRLEARSFETIWGLAHDANAYLQPAKREMDEEFPWIVDTLATGLRRRLGERAYQLDLPVPMTLVRTP
ncbi:MAG: hypothetical protein MI724_06065 [Spirochaetales bacterium]|nr:hypothetical protein [Spirochaetales bacterium]